MANLDYKSLASGALVALPGNKLPEPIKVEVIFGVPGQSCNGVGICKILPQEHVRVNWSCPHTQALLSYCPGGALKLSFDRRTLKAEYAERYFGNQIFRIIESYTLSNAVYTLLNSGPQTIDAGEYTVLVSEHFLTLMFKSN